MIRCGFHNPAVVPLGNLPLGVPAFDGRRRATDLCCHRSDTTEFFEYAQGVGMCGDVHVSHSNRTLDVRQSHYNCASDFRTLSHMEKSADDILRALDRLKIPHDEIAESLGRDRTVATKLMGKKRSMKAHEIPALLQLIERYERDNGEVESATQRDYLAVEILPTFAGMGGGGSGDGDKEFGLVSRRMIVDELHAKPADLLIIEARGDSMEPDFQHGDQILIDKRDTNPIQPGPFALWDGDGFVVKLVERVPTDRGRYRIFSSNNRYSSYEVSVEDVKIMGRPVWFGRRL